MLLLEKEELMDGTVALKDLHVELLGEVCGFFLIVSLFILGTFLPFLSIPSIFFLPFLLRPTFTDAC